jgi:hypothetical protein
LFDRKEYTVALDEVTQLIDSLLMNTSSLDSTDFRNYYFMCQGDTIGALFRYCPIMPFNGELWINCYRYDFEKSQVATVVKLLNNWYEYDQLKDVGWDRLIFQNWTFNIDPFNPDTVIPGNLSTCTGGNGYWVFPVSSPGFFEFRIFRNGHLESRYYIASQDCTQVWICDEVYSDKLSYQILYKNGVISLLRIEERDAKSKYRRIYEYTFNRKGKLVSAQDLTNDRNIRFKLLFKPKRNVLDMSEKELVNEYLRLSKYPIVLEQEREYPFPRIYVE